jgi:4-amino-4-deoxychorismate lyase
MSHFFESIKVDNGSVCNLVYHAQRVISTYGAVYGTRPGWNLGEAIASSPIPESGLYKCRVVYDQHKYSVEFEQYTVRAIGALRLVMADDIEYSHKKVDRKDLDDLFAMRRGCDDVLIVKRGRITDTTAANIVLMNDQGEWLTPSDCLLKGTMRQSLLDSGRIFERSIGLEDLRRLKRFKLISAMRNWSLPEADVSDIIE